MNSMNPTTANRIDAIRAKEIEIDRRAKLLWNAWAPSCTCGNRGGRLHAPECSMEVLMRDARDRARQEMVREAAGRPSPCPDCGPTAATEPHPPVNGVACRSCTSCGCTYRIDHATTAESWRMVPAEADRAADIAKCHHEAATLAEAILAITTALERLPANGGHQRDALRASLSQSLRLAREERTDWMAAARIAEKAPR